MVSKIISLDGSFDDSQKTEEQGGEVRLCFLAPIQELYLIQGVNQDGVLQPMRLVARAVGSKLFYALAQNADGIVLDPAETKAVDSFFANVESRAMLLGGKMPVPIGDVSQFTGVNDFLPKSAPDSSS